MILVSETIAEQQNVENNARAVTKSLSLMMPYLQHRALSPIATRRLGPLVGLLLFNTQHGKKLHALLTYNCSNRIPCQLHIASRLQQSLST